jgi:hypothetical protein
MVVVVRLLTAGSDTGPFNLYTNADGFTTPIAVAVLKSRLTTGFTLPSVPLGTTLIRAESLGICENNYTVAISPGYIGPPTTSTTSTTSTSTTLYVGPITSTTTSTTSTSTSTSTSTTSTSTTRFVAAPSFELIYQEIPGFDFVKINNVVNGTRFNHNVGATYTAPNTCLNPMGTIDPDEGESSFTVIPSVPCGTPITVRVYNYLGQPNCSVYTDRTVIACS